MKKYWTYNTKLWVPHLNISLHFQKSLANIIFNDYIILNQVPPFTLTHVDIWVISKILLKMELGGNNSPECLSVWNKALHMGLRMEGRSLHRREGDRENVYCVTPKKVAQVRVGGRRDEKKEKEKSES